MTLQPIPDMKYRLFFQSIICILMFSALGTTLLPQSVFAAPAISISPKSGVPGTKVTVSGTNFASYADGNLSVFFNDTEVARIAGPVFVSGYFQVVFEVPASAKLGKAVISIRGVIGSNLAEEIFTVTGLELNLSKDTGEVGAKLTLSGGGSKAGRTVTITFDAEELVILTADDTGAFTCTFTVPISTAGVHIITVTDGVNLRQITYIVEAEAPAPPEPLSPKQYAVVTLPFTFDWEGVYDISQPLFYTLQVAHTADFQHPVLERSSLIASQYTLGNGKTLLPNRRGTHYYWRLRAVDGASNVGEWSAPANFRVKPADVLPAWARYVLIAVQVVISLVFAYRIWKGAKNKESES
jgi:hypothetical protein